MVNEAVKGAQQRSFFKEAFKIFLEELKNDGFIHRLYLKTFTTAGPFPHNFQMPGSAFAFIFWEGDFGTVTVNFRDTSLPVLNLGVGGAMRYDQQPWDTGVLRDDQFVALSNAFRGACREFLRRQNIKVSAEAKQFFEM